MKRITIAEVAVQAGVSPTAVSFAFNKPDQLNSNTVARIHRVAGELGYMPNPVARALIAQQVGVIGVLMPQPLGTVLANTYFHNFLQGVGTICDEERLSMLAISPLNGSLNHAFISSPVDGFIICGFHESHHEVALLRGRKVPYVLVDGDAVNAPTVNVDDEQGAYDAAEYLLKQGHRDILILMLETAFGHADEVAYGVGMRRLNGYRRAFADYGVAWRDEWVIPCVSTFEGGQQGYETASESGIRPSAILAASDAIAIGAIQIIERFGLRVPKDIEVIGFDDTVAASLMRPQLSTVHQPIFEKGRAAMELLVAEIKGNMPQKHITFPARLVLRGSTRDSASETALMEVAAQ